MITICAATQGNDIAQPAKPFVRSSSDRNEERGEKKKIMVYFYVFEHSFSTLVYIDVVMEYTEVHQLTTKSQRG